MASVPGRSATTINVQILPKYIVSQLQKILCLNLIILVSLSWSPKGIGNWHGNEGERLQCIFPAVAGPCVGTRLSTLPTLEPAEAPGEPKSLFKDREFTQRIPLFKGTEKPKRRLQTNCETLSQPPQNRFVYPFTEILSCYFSFSITLIRFSSF